MRSVSTSVAPSCSPSGSSDGKVVDEYKTSKPDDGAMMVEAIVAAVEQLARAKRLRHCGVGVAGLVDFERGSIRVGSPRRRRSTSASGTSWRLLLSFQSPSTTTPTRPHWLNTRSEPGVAARPC